MSQSDSKLARWDAGPYTLVEPEEGIFLSDPISGLKYRLRLGPHNFPVNTVSCGDMFLEAGDCLSARVHPTIDMIFFVVTGSILIASKNQTQEVRPDGVAFVQHGSGYELSAVESARLIWISTPNGFEDAARVQHLKERTQHSGISQHIELATQTKSLEDGLNGSDQSIRSHVIVRNSEDGWSNWQAEPTRGYTNALLTPEVTGSVSFAMGIQTIAPNGGELLTHAHARNEEMKIVIRGQGEATLNGVDAPVEQGSLVFNGRYINHGFRNHGDTEMAILWFITPPGLEYFLEAIGRPRQHGESEPAPFDFPENILSLLNQHGFDTKVNRAISEQEN